MNINLIVMIGYFVLMIGISFCFKKVGSASTTHYFRGGGKMLWWMVGATAFMVQFSAWTFTGASGQAYRYGFNVVSVFLGNTFGYLMAWWWFSSRFRQMRVDTATEAVRRRFGHGNELFFTWIVIPLSILNAGVWLNSLGVFVSAVFHLDIVLTLWIVGLVVLVISLLGGAWGVVASDFVQTLIIAIISVSCAVVALFKVGGPVNLVTHFPSGFFSGVDTGPHYILILIGCFIFFFIKQLQSVNNMQDCYRFLNSKDSFNAKKAAMFALLLMLVGTFIWFIPSWASAILYPNAVNSHTELGKNMADAVYLIFTEKAMPNGMVGLLIAGLFSATMSSMDAALNRNSGIFVRSFWTPVINKKEKKSDKYQLRVGQCACIVNGILVILVAQYMQTLHSLTLFDLMIKVGTLLSAPIMVPLFFGIFIRKTPDWAAWVTVIIGLCISYVISHWFTGADVAHLIFTSVTKREISDISNMWNIFCHLVFTGGFFCLTSLFYKEKESPRQKELQHFFEDCVTPVYAEEDQDMYDRFQRVRIGQVAMIMGIAILFLMLVPNPLLGRLLFLVFAVVIVGFGYFLYRSGKKGDGSLLKTHTI